MKTLIEVAGVRGPDLVYGATGVRLSSGRIEAIGPVESLRGDKIDEMSFSNGIVVPLLRDAHLHPSGYVQAVDGLSVASAVDLDHLAEMVELHRQVQPEGPLFGSRLDDEKLAGGLPDRHALDRIENVRSLVLMRHCGHVAVANTAALQRAGIGIGTHDPPGGSFDRDDDGRPNGIMRESAVPLVTGPLSRVSPDPDPARLLEVLSALPALGIGSIDAMVKAGDPIWCGSGNELEQLLEVDAQLPIDVNVFVITESVDELQDAAKRIRTVGNRLRFAGWKGFADGSLGGHTAAMWAPFSDRKDTNGILRLDTTRHRQLIDLSLDLGGAVAFHAIGDRANTAVLSMFEHIVDRGVDPSRLRVEHASVLTPGLIEQIGRLGVTASVQPSFMRSEADWVPGRIGERARMTYPLRSLQAAGVRMLGGSDCPVEDPNPWSAMAAARQHPFDPEESLDAASAFGLYVDRGIAVGDPASFAILDVDPVAADPAALAGTTVLAAWVEGNRTAARPPVWPQ